MSIRLSIRALLSVLFLFLTLEINLSAQSVKSFVTVDAARYQPAVAPDSIVAGFSSQLTTTESLATQDVDAVTPGIQLPTSLGGLRVLVNNRAAELLYVGPNQINYIVPSQTELDAPATVVVTDSQGNTVAQGSLTMASHSLSLFTYNQSGTGMPAGQVTADGIVYSSVVNGDGSPNTVPPGQYLVLFGTGIRAGQDVRAQIGGVEATVEYAGSQQYFIGLDQINIHVPQGLTGQGLLEVVISDGSTTSNPVLINVGGNPEAPAGAPVITSVGATDAAAGQIVTISGSSFASSVSAASVRIGSSVGQVLAVSPTSMTFVLPYGVASGKVVAGNTLGERQSDSTLTIQTSVSGSVLNNADAPVTGMLVSVAGTSVSTVTDAAGRFLLVGVPRGTVELNFDTSNFPANLGLPNLSYSTVVSEGRDNELGYSVYLPGGLGTYSFAASPTLGNKLEVDPTPVVLVNDGVQLTVPSTFTFPDGKTTGKLGVLRLPLDGRLPAILPSGIFPIGAALITPMGTTFGTKDSGQATLSFPNTENLPAGTSVDLYAFRSKIAPSGFVKKGQAVVSSDGKAIVASALIDIATVWFVALPAEQAPVTTVIGTVVGSNDKPVTKARVLVRGRSGVTDTKGKFEIKGVRVKNGENLNVEVLFFTPTGAPLKASKSVTAVVQGVTDAGTIKLPVAPPLALLIRPMEVRTTPNVMVELKVVLSRALTAPATINFTNGEGVVLDISPASLTIDAGKTEGVFKVKSSVAGKGTVIAKLAATVDDATPDNTRKGEAKVYITAPAPVLNTVNPVSGAPGSTFNLNGAGLNTDPGKNVIFFQQGDRVVPVDPKTVKVTNPTIVSPEAGINLSGAVPGLKPGEALVFVSLMVDGVPSAPSNKLKFMVTAPAAPQLASINPTSALPGAAFYITGSGLSLDPKQNGIFFKIGDSIIPASPEFLQVLTSATVPAGSLILRGIVPRMIAGDADVFVITYQNGAPSEKSNLLKFKVLAPTGPVLTTIDPKQGQAGSVFTITGSGFDPEPRRNFVFFKQGDRFIQLDPATVKSDGKTFVSAFVPKILVGDYEVFVLTNLESAVSLNGLPPGTPSNKLLFKIIPPPAAVVASITPAEGLPGAAFVLKGQGFEADSGRNRVIFKQADKFLMLDQRLVKADATTVSAVVPDLPAGVYDVIVLTQPEAPALNGLPPGIPSNAMKFTVLPVPVPVLETISPTEIIQGGAFMLTGKNLNKNFVVVFKQGDKQFIVPTLLLKLENGVLSGTIPNDLLPGAAEVFQAQSSTGPFSNKLSFTVKAKP